MADRPPLPTSLRCSACGVAVNDMNTGRTCPQCGSVIVAELPSGSSTPISTLLTTNRAFDLLTSSRIRRNITAVRAVHNLFARIMDLLVSYAARWLFPQTNARIPKLQVTSEHIVRDGRCTICLEDFVLGETVQKLCCLHIFHGECIAQWLELNDTCPICRKSVHEEEQGTHIGGNNSDGATETAPDLISSEPFPRASGTNGAGSNTDEGPLTARYDNETQNDSD